MISRLQGEVVEVPGDGSVLLRIDSMTLRVLVPAYEENLYTEQIGQIVELHTLFSIEAVGQGNTLLPRLIGFRTPGTRSFFELFTTVKGIGQRKALRALAAPVPTIAAAIADRNVRFLQGLPEIGKRTAETIVAELNGKVERYIGELEAGSDGASGRGGSRGPDAISSGVSGGLNWSNRVPTEQREIADQALAVLLQLGENRQQAAQWIEVVYLRAAGSDGRMDIVESPFHDAQELVAAVYRNKG